MEAIEPPYVKLLSTACTPTHAMPKSIGLDLYSPTGMLIPAHDKVLINTGIAFQIPMGYYGQIAPRLGLAFHHHIHVGARVVDPNYTGPVQVLLLNFSHQNHTIEVNNHIAQLILERIAYPILCEVLQIPDRVWHPRIWFHRKSNKGEDIISLSHLLKSLGLIENGNVSMALNL